MKQTKQSVMDSSEQTLENQAQQELREKLIREINRLKAISKHNGNQLESLRGQTAEEYTFASLQFLQLMSIQLRDRQNQDIRKINDTLLRIQKGTFGICRNCNGKIDDARLKALPTAERCIGCQEDFDKVSRWYRRSEIVAPKGKWDFPEGTLDHSRCTADYCCVTGRRCRVKAIDGGPI